MRFRILLSCVFALIVFDTTDARADNEARQHFEIGKKRRDEGDCAAAIPEFDKSLATEKSVGAYYNLGYCHEQLGHRQQAYDAYKRAQELASSKKDDRYREISGALAALLDTDHVRLILPQPLPEGLEIRVDDELIPPSIYATETVIFTKPTKTHAVTVTAPGFEARHETVETKQVKAIELRRPPENGAAPVPPPQVKVEPGGFGAQHWVGIGMAGAGLVTGAVGLFFLLDYLPERSRLDKELDAHPCYDGHALSCQRETPVKENEEAAKSAADLRQRNNDLERDITVKSISLFSVGGALIVGGVVVYLLAPRSPSAQPATSSWFVAPQFGSVRGQRTAGVTFGAKF